MDSKTKAISQAALDEQFIQEAFEAAQKKVAKNKNTLFLKKPFSEVIKDIHPTQCINIVVTKKVPTIEEVNIAATDEDLEEPSSEDLEEDIEEDEKLPEKLSDE